MHAGLWDAILMCVAVKIYVQTDQSIKDKEKKWTHISSVNEPTYTAMQKSFRRSKLDQLSITDICFFLVRNLDPIWTAPCSDGTILTKFKQRHCNRGVACKAPRRIKIPWIVIVWTYILSWQFVSFKTRFLLRYLNFFVGPTYIFAMDQHFTLFAVCCW